MPTLFVVSLQHINLPPSELETANTTYPNYFSRILSAYIHVFRRSRFKIFPVKGRAGAGKGIFRSSKSDPWCQALPALLQKTSSWVGRFSHKLSELALLYTPVISSCPMESAVMLADCVHRGWCLEWRKGPAFCLASRDSDTRFSTSGFFHESVSPSPWVYQS